MITLVIGFLASKYGRYVVFASVVLLAMFAIPNHYRKQGAARVSAQIEKKVEANAQKANEVRSSVQSVPASSLRDKWTRE